MQILGILFRTVPRKRTQLGNPFRAIKNKINSQNAVPEHSVEEKPTQDKTRQPNILITSGFWPRVRAVSCAHPLLLVLLTRHTGRCAPHAHRNFASSYSSPKNKKNNYFHKQNASLYARTRATRGVYLST
jgi:hypothetical protein